MLDEYHEVLVTVHLYFVETQSLIPDIVMGEFNRAGFRSLSRSNASFLCFELKTGRLHSREIGTSAGQRTASHHLPCLGAALGQRLPTILQGASNFGHAI